jgi:hypothetical protein
MPFREKTAWIMSAALIVGGFSYFGAIVSDWSGSGQLASPMFRPTLIFTACLVAIAIVGHIAIAILTPKDADAPLDERERQIFNRAGHYSAYVMGVGIVMSLALYVFTKSGDLLFYTAFASLLIGQVVEYFLQILFYRTSV